MEMMGFLNESLQSMLNQVMRFFFFYNYIETSVTSVVRY